MVLIHAYSFEGKTINGQQVRELIGNVEFRQGDARMLCDRAMQFLDEQRTLFEGHVHFSDSSKQLFADKVLYYETSRLTLAERNVKLIDSTKTLSSDELQYFDMEDKALAKGHVILVDYNERITLRGGQAEYLRLKGYAKVTDKPVMVKSDSTESRDLIIDGESMEMFDDGKRIIATGNVHVTRGEVVAECGELEFLPKQNRAILSKAPKARRENDHLTGKNIDLILNGTEITGIQIAGDGLVISQVDTLIATKIPFDLLTGEDIQVSIAEEQIDSVIVKGRATSYYHVIEDEKEKGLNKVLGDEIRMFFRGSHIKRVDVKSSPSTSVGTFFPPSSKAGVENELSALLAKNGVVFSDSLQTNIPLP